jgi:hypothetical protein
MELNREGSEMTGNPYPFGTDACTGAHDAFTRDSHERRRLLEEAERTSPELWRWSHAGGAEPKVAPAIRVRFFALLREAAERHTERGIYAMGPAPLART